MKVKLKSALLGTLSLLLSWQASSAELIDKVAVIVNQGVVLESEVKSIINDFKQGAKVRNQALPSDKALRTQVLERLISNNLLMQMAEKSGLQVSDAQLQSAIENIAAEQKMTLAELRNNIIASGAGYEAFRENVRVEIITSEVRRSSVSRQVYVSQQEIDSLVSMLNERGRKDDEYNLGHILIALPSEASASVIDDTKKRAGKVLKLLNDGRDFKKMAISSSSGAKALDGGDLGWMNINEMPTLFAEAVENIKKGDIIGPIRSGAGFHILTLHDTRGMEVVEMEEINSRHILIQPSIILSDARAKEMLEGFLVDVKAGNADFEELAKEHSADPGSATQGGELGWSDPSRYVPEFRDTLLALNEGEYGGPFRTSHGWHIVQVIAKRQLDVTDKMQENRAYQMLFKRKFSEEAETWMRQVRDSAYIQIMD